MPDDGIEEVSKHVADCVSIVFTFHCIFDKEKDVQLVSNKYALTLFCL